MRFAPNRSIIRVVLVFGAVTVVIAAGALALGAGVAALLIRVLDRLDGPDDDEPAWWPEFERRFAEYVQAQHEAS